MIIGLLSILTIGNIMLLEIFSRYEYYVLSKTLCFAKSTENMLICATFVFLPLLVYANFANFRDN